MNVQKSLGFVLLLRFDVERVRNVYFDLCLIFAYKVFDAKGLTFTQSMMYHLYMLVSVDKIFEENLILNCIKQILD